MTLLQADAALAVFAVAPQALGGVHLRCAAGAAREAWLATLRAALPPEMPWRRLPLHTSDETLDGGLDLARTLASGTKVAERGLLAAAAGGVVLATMAERLSVARAARLCHALDPTDATIALIALDEGLDDAETTPAALLDRLALRVVPDATPLTPDPDSVAHARATWSTVELGPELIEALVSAAAALGVDSVRATCHALSVARIAAALDGRERATPDDAALAASLVLAPRATRLPPAPAPDEENEPPQEPPEPPESPSSDRADNAPDDEDMSPPPEQPLNERVVEAAQAAIPPGLLALLASGRKAGPRRGEAGRVGLSAASHQRGRAIGATRGEPRGGARLALIETLRAAAPWQALRRRQAGRTEHVVGDRVVGDRVLAERVFVERDDLRIQRRVQQRATTTIFAIDASGSQALHRLAEAKGAVELLLADCYARRDKVAVIGFRGPRAELMLAQTRSLVRARRQLAGLSGGGGTPLAAGIDAAAQLAATVRRAGATPLVVFLTDGRANIARSGAPGRAAATSDAIAAARAFAAAGTAALLIDTSAQPSPAAATLAEAMRARCIALPYAAAATLSAAVRIERGSAGPRHG